MNENLTVKTIPTVLQAYEVFDRRDPGWNTRTASCRPPRTSPSGRRTFPGSPGLSRSWPDAAAYRQDLIYPQQGQHAGRSRLRVEQVQPSPRPKLSRGKRSQAAVINPSCRSTVQLLPFWSAHNQDARQGRHVRWRTGNFRADSPARYSSGSCGRGGGKRPRPGRGDTGARRARAKGPAYDWRPRPVTTSRSRSAAPAIGPAVFCTPSFGGVCGCGRVGASFFAWMIFSPSSPACC
jgi:hypothetical protein